MDVLTLARGCEDYGIKVPKAVEQAEALARAVAALVANVKAETQPDPESLTPKNVEALHAAMVAWPSHDARETAAHKLQAVADLRISTAWMGAVVDLMERFRKPFDDLADRFRTGDTEAVHGLAELKRVRDELAGEYRADVMPRPLEEMTRCMVIPSARVVLNTIPVRVGGDPFKSAPSPWSAQWLTIVLGIPGVELRWNSPSEQVEIAAAALRRAA